MADRIRDTGADRIAVVSVMGAYRTGKSFLLDLFLRYLRHKARVETSHETEPESVADPKQSLNSGSDPAIAGPSVGCRPLWMSEEGDFILEGQQTSRWARGFQWRGGMEKCTTGCWFWSEPFIIQRPKRNQHGHDITEKVAVLLLDSQGAFDSQMTKEQSATIFGLTAVLSSHLIYNVSKQLQEDSIESLHYFMECASSCIRLLSPEKDVEPKLFQHLEFLIRDWANFEPDWDMDTCEKQMKDHLAQHFDHSRDASTPDAIRKMFEDVACWALPHPGLRMNKLGWDGRISDLDGEFIRFLDEYAKRTFGPSLREREVLGKPLTAATFTEVIVSFVSAFKDLVPKGANLAKAVARSSNLMSKEQAIGDFKSSVEKLIGKETSKGVSEDDFTKAELKARKSALDLYMKQTNFGPVDDRNAIRDELVHELDKLRAFYQAENIRRLESTLTVFSGLAVLVCVLYLIDKISDFTCDWYSDTCVRVSSALFLVYFTIVVAILTNAYFLYQSRGQAVTLMALIELTKGSIALLMEYFTSLKSIFLDLKESKNDELKAHVARLLEQIGRDMKKGFVAVHTSFTDAFLSS